MPLVQIKGISGYLSLEQKQAIIERVTNAVQSGAWGVGGVHVTADNLRELAHRK